MAKKSIALILAILSLVSNCILVSAESTFNDSSDISRQYKEAVDYAFQAGIIGGYADGTFRPKQNLTRGAATKFIAIMELGADKAASLTADTAPYTDIPTTHNFAGYVSYCSKQEYISGYDDGTFKASNLLTAEAFAKMLLCTIQYPSATGYTGTNWKDIVLLDAMTCGIFNGNMGFMASDTLTREQAAYMLYNAVYWRRMGINRPEAAPKTYAPTVQEPSQPTAEPVAPTVVPASKGTPSYGTSSNPPASAVPLTVEALQGVWLGGVPVYEGYRCAYGCNRHFLNVSGNNFNLDHLHSSPDCQDKGTFYIDGSNIIATYRQHFSSTGAVSDWKTEIWTVEYIFPGGIRFQDGVAGFKSFWTYDVGPYGPVTIESTTPPVLEPTRPSIPSAPSTPNTSTIPSTIPPANPSTTDAVAIRDLQLARDAYWRLCNKAIFPDTVQIHAIWAANGHSDPLSSSETIVIYYSAETRGGNRRRNYYRAHYNADGSFQVDGSDDSKPEWRIIPRTVDIAQVIGFIG